MNTTYAILIGYLYVVAAKHQVLCKVIKRFLLDLDKNYKSLLANNKLHVNN